MERRESNRYRMLIICVVLNGILVAFLLLSKTSPAIGVLVGAVITVVLWRVALSMTPGPIALKEAPVRAPAALAERVPSGEPAVQMLSALQREGRLIDFLQEDLTAYDDGQIGAAVRTIHSGCKQALKEYLDLRPVYQETEGNTVTVPAGFDARAVRLTGNVTGHPPFRGILRHRGWKVDRLRLPSGEEKNEWILAPAEVEVE
jgi:hypothetical protein